MSFHKLDPGDEDFLTPCPVCGEGYMVPTMGDWYQCSECGEEAEDDGYGNLLFDSDEYDDFVEDDDEDSEDGESLSVEDAALIWASNGKDEDYMFGYTEEELEDAL